DPFPDELGEPRLLQVMRVMPRRHGMPCRRRAFEAPSRTIGTKIRRALVHAGGIHRLQRVQRVVGSRTDEPGMAPVGNDETLVMMLNHETGPPSGMTVPGTGAPRVDLDQPPPPDPGRRANVPAFRG